MHLAAGALEADRWIEVGGYMDWIQFISMGRPATAANRRAPLETGRAPMKAKQESAQKHTPQTQQGPHLFFFFFKRDVRFASSFHFTSPLLVLISPLPSLSGLV